MTSAVAWPGTPRPKTSWACGDSPPLGPPSSTSPFPTVRWPPSTVDGVALHCLDAVMGTSRAAGATRAMTTGTTTASTTDRTHRAGMSTARSRCRVNIRARGATVAKVRWATSRLARVTLWWVMCETTAAPRSAHRSRVSRTVRPGVPVRAIRAEVAAQVRRRRVPAQRRQVPIPRVIRRWTGGPWRRRAPAGRRRRCGRGPRRRAGRGLPTRRGRCAG